MGERTNGECLLVKGERTNGFVFYASQIIEIQDKVEELGHFGNKGVHFY